MNTEIFLFIPWILLGLIWSLFDIKEKRIHLISLITSAALSLSKVFLFGLPICFSYFFISYIALFLFQHFIKIADIIMFIFSSLWLNNLLELSLLCILCGFLNLITSIFYKPHIPFLPSLFIATVITVVARP